MPKNDEDGPRLACDKFFGGKGAEFTAWSKEFLDAADGVGDEEASYAQQYLGLAPPPTNAAGTKRCDARNRGSYSWLLP